jgi:hypothetical protein
VFFLTNLFLKRKFWKKNFFWNNWDSCECQEDFFLFCFLKFCIHHFGWRCSALLVSRIEIDELCVCLVRKEKADDITSKYTPSSRLLIPVFLKIYFTRFVFFFFVCLCVFVPPLMLECLLLLLFSTKRKEKRVRLYPPPTNAPVEPPSHWWLYDVNHERFCFCFLLHFFCPFRFLSLNITEQKQTFFFSCGIIK